MSPTDAEWRILDLLLDADERTITISELVWAIGSPAATAEALDALNTTGFICRRGDLVLLAAAGRDAPR
jgi:hypothetical protein